MSAAAASSGRSAAGRRVYRQSQVEAPQPAVPPNQIASYIAPAGAFVVVSLGISHPILSSSI